jgi:hypothetical protein
MLDIFREIAENLGNLSGLGGAYANLGLGGGYMSYLSGVGGAY